LLPAGKVRSREDDRCRQATKLVKEEDKEHPHRRQLHRAGHSAISGGFGAAFFILPDQAGSEQPVSNPNNPLNPTQNLGSSPKARGRPQGVSRASGLASAHSASCPITSACFPYSAEVSPFAGASPSPSATAKKVTLEDQMSASGQVLGVSARHTSLPLPTGFHSGTTCPSEFDPFSAANSVRSLPWPNLPVFHQGISAANEILRTYSDQWGPSYKRIELLDLGKSNPPNPTGYAPHDDGLPA